MGAFPFHALLHRLRVTAALPLCLLAEGSTLRHNVKELLPVE
jgi:hypothetical protein